MRLLKSATGTSNTIATGPTQTPPLHHVRQLQDAYKITGVNSIDLSLSMSGFSMERVKSLLPVRFQPYQKISINLANNPIGSNGADYVLSLIPNGV